MGAADKATDDQPQALAPWPELRGWLKDNPEHLLADHELLRELELKPAAKNVVEFGPAALSRLEEAVKRESGARRAVEHVARANCPAPAGPQLFGARAEEVKSVALVRMALWSPARHAVIAFGSPEPEGFTPDMGCELIAFVTRVVERVAERWPVLDPAA